MTINIIQGTKTREHTIKYLTKEEMYWSRPNEMNIWSTSRVNSFKFLENHFWTYSRPSSSLGISSDEKSPDLYSLKANSSSSSLVRLPQNLMNLPLFNSSAGKNNKEGQPLISNSQQRSFARLSVQSTLAKLISEWLSQSSAQIGARCLQWPHHGA